MNFLFEEFIFCVISKVFRVEMVGDSIFGKIGSMFEHKSYCFILNANVCFVRYNESVFLLFFYTELQYDCQNLSWLACAF